MKLDEIKELKQETLLKISVSQIFPEVANRLFVMLVAFPTLVLLINYFLLQWYLRSLLTYSGTLFGIILLKGGYTFFIQKLQNYIRTIVMKPDKILFHSLNSTQELDIKAISSYGIVSLFPANLVGFSKVKIKIANSSAISFYVRTHFKQRNEFENCMERYLGSVNASQESNAELDQKKGKTVKVFITTLQAVIGVILLAALLIHIPFTMYQNLKKSGITIRAKRDIPVKQVKYYKQVQDEWREDIMGNEGYLVERYGCLLCVVASSIGYISNDITPGALNKLFVENDVYNDQAEIIWNRITKVVPEVTYGYKRLITSGIVLKLLENEILPIVKVKYCGGHIFHWVLIVGAEDGDYLVFDPLHKGEEPIPLSRHGRVYALRYIIQND